MNEIAPSYAVPPRVAWMTDERDGQLRIYLTTMDDLQAVVLEGVAAVIWQTARQAPGADITSQVADFIGEPADSVRGAVTQFLAQLVEGSLLEPLRTKD